MFRVQQLILRWANPPCKAAPAPRDRNTILLFMFMNDSDAAAQSHPHHPRGPRQPQRENQQRPAGSRQVSSSVCEAIHKLNRGPPATIRTPSLAEPDPSCNAFSGVAFPVKWRQPPCLSLHSRGLAAIQASELASWAFVGTAAISVQCGAAMICRRERKSRHGRSSWTFRLV